MEDLLDSRVIRQLAREDGIRAEADERGSCMVQDALDSGRFADLPEGRQLLAKAYSQCCTDVDTLLGSRCTGQGAKYRALLRRVSTPVLVLLGMRTLLNACTDEQNTRIQQVLRETGKAIESEAIVAALEKAAPVYLERTLQYLDGGKTQSVHHRRRTFLAAAEHTIGTWEHWSNAEREGAARLLLAALFDTGLFIWKPVQARGGKHLHLRPAPRLEQHFADVLEQARPITRFEPMLCKPDNWTSYGAGGYLTPWMRIRSPMVALRSTEKSLREWVIGELPKAERLLAAMNKAQSTPYRVNRDVLDWLQKALAIEAGVMGLPQHGTTSQPAFPFPASWGTQTASVEEMETFDVWKKQKAAWHAEESRRASKKGSIISAARQMRKLVDEPSLYFVTYADYRGRVYFRGNLHPQSHDAIKGCLEFANGEPLGKDGLFWLKVHVAGCAGYDKKDFPLRAAWTEENWGSIQEWLKNPLLADCPEPDTAFTFLAAALALQNALSSPNPEEYVCRVPVAMDATCSGLQHFSAMFRDEVGAQYTNLMDSGGDEKQDIYKKVAETAQCALSFDDVSVRGFWEGKEISRGMSKRPVMTFLYGSTLRSNMDYVSLSLADEGHSPITGKDGKVLYSLTKLAVPVAKALRTGVVTTVPKAAAGMKYLQDIARRSAVPMRWVTPVGMPVLNWAEGTDTLRVAIRSMGVQSIVMARDDGKYNAVKATAAIAPNFVHSMDGAHLCMVLAEAPFAIQPIHDSFACHPCNVAELHSILRSTFVELYQTDALEQLRSTALRDKLELPDAPTKGNLDIREVQSSRFMFC